MKRKGTNMFAKNDAYDGNVPICGCEATLYDGKLTICRVGYWTDFYLHFDEENTNKLRELIGGNIKENFEKYFSSDDPFYTVRDYCDKNEIQYRYDSWTSGDDMDDIADFISSFEERH